MQKTNMPECPECAKIEALKGSVGENGKFIPGPADTVQSFLEWLTKNYWICQINEYEFTPVYKPIEHWMAEYFEIDLKKVEKEKLAVLEYVREINSRDSSDEPSKSSQEN